MYFLVRIILTIHFTVCSFSSSNKMVLEQIILGFNRGIVMNKKETLKWLKHIVEQKKIFLDTDWDERANYLFIDKLCKTVWLVGSYKKGRFYEHEGDDKFTYIDQDYDEISTMTQTRLSGYEIIDKDEFFRRRALVKSIWETGIVRERMNEYLSRNKLGMTELEKILVEIL